jgi:hypothetical protein
MISCSIIGGDVRTGGTTIARGAAVGSRHPGFPSLQDRLAMRSAMPTMQMFGSTPNDGIDDSAAFSDACRQACLMRQPLWLLPGTYDITEKTTITCTDDLLLIGMGDVQINLDGFLTFRADTADDMILLRQDAPRGSRSIVVDDTSHCSVGDLVCIDTAVVAESAWKTPKREVHRIEAIPDAATLRFEEPLVFSYGTADEGLAIRAYKRRRITIINVTFDVNDRQLATQYFSGGTVLYGCRWTERDEGEQDGYHYSPGWSIGVTVNDAVFEGGYYGCIPACSRDVTFEWVKGYRCKGHVIAPNNWCYGVHVKNISGSECGSLVDSHPSFEVHYSNVSGSITGMPNLRSLGGSIRNYQVESTVSEPGVIYLQNIELQVDREIYDETTFLLQDFTLTTPNLDPNQSENRAIVAYGRQAVLKHVNWWWFDFHPGPDQDGPTNGFHEIQISDCNLTCLSLWRGEQVTISNSHFASLIDAGNPYDVGIGVQAEARCSVDNTTFADYTHAISVPWTRTIDFTDCLFTDCGTVFAASGMAIEAAFNRCEFVDVGGWGDIDTSHLQVQESTFTSTRADSSKWLGQ